MKKFIFVLFMISCSCLRAQKSGTMGTEFWLTATQNSSDSSQNYPFNFGNFLIFINAPQYSLVTISNPNTSYTKTISVPAGTLVMDSILLSECYNNNGSGIILNKGLKITATSEIALYAANQSWGENDASAILPVTSLGLKYWVMSSRAEAQVGRSEFCIVATRDSTRINITPSANTLDGKTSGNMYTINLNKGQSYQVKALAYQSDLTGSLIEVQNCKPIAVFGDNTKADVHCFGSGNLYEQLFPVNSWGKEFILIPTSGHIKDAIMIVADKSNTTIRFNGTLITLANAGDKYDGEIFNPSYITSNKPICVCIYGVGQECSSSVGNPFMIWVSPVEQKVKASRFSTIFSILQPSALGLFYVNIVVRATTTGSVKLDNTSLTNSFLPVSFNKKYSYVQMPITKGVHTITSDSGFIAYSYGYGQGGGYGFNVGSSNLELERYFTANALKNNDYGTPSQALHFCKNSNIIFKGNSSNYTPVFWRWKFGNDSAATQNVTKSFADTGLIRVMLITGRYNSTCSNDTSLDTAFQYIRIVVPHVNILTAGNARCKGSPFQVQVDYSDDSPIQWQSSPDLSCEDCPQPIIKPSASKWYKVTLGGGTLGCSVSDSIYVHVIDTIQYKTLYDTIICQGDTTAIQAIVLNPDTITSYTFSIYADTNLLVQNNSGILKILPDSTRAYLIKINNGCSDVSSKIFIKVIPKIDLKYQIDSIYPRCENRNLKLSLSTNYNDSILLNWGDGADTILKSNNHVLTHSYAALGLKTVSIRAIANKCMDSAGFTFIVRLPMQLVASNDTVLCKGAFTSLWAKASGGDSVFSYILKSPTATLQNTSGLFLVSPDSSTTFIIGAINTCVNDTLWKQITVTIRRPLALQLNIRDTTLCKGNLFTIIATATGGNGNYNYFLKKNNIIQQSNTIGSFNITANSNEIYTVVLRDNCTVINDSLTCKINIFNILQFTQTLPDLYLCPGSNATIKTSTNKGSGAVSYLWTDALGTILSTTDSLQITPTTSIQIILKATDACISIYDTLWIYEFATSSSAQLLTDVLSGCMPLTVNFETPKLNFSNNQPCEAQWDFGDGNSLTQSFTNTSSTLKAKHTYSNAGVYQAKVKVKFKNSINSCYTFNTTIEALIVPQISLSIVPKKITLPNTQCTATITTTNADSVVIDWADGFSDYFANLNLNLNILTQTHDYSDTGHYTVKAIAYNKNTCYTEADVNVYHADTFMCFIPNAFSPNKDGTNETFKPVISFCKSYVLTIYNRWGEVVYETNYTSGNPPQPAWSGEGNPSDTYLYIFTAIDGDNFKHNLKGTVIMLR